MVVLKMSIKFGAFTVPNIQGGCGMLAWKRKLPTTGSMRLCLCFKVDH